MLKLRSNKILMQFGLIVILLSQIIVNAEEDIQIPLLKPSLKFKTLPEYEEEIKEAGVLLKNDYVYLFAPKIKSKEAPPVKNRKASPFPGGVRSG